MPQNQAGTFAACMLGGHNPQDYALIVAWEPVVGRPLTQVQGSVLDHWCLRAVTGLKLGVCGANSALLLAAVAAASGDAAAARTEVVHS